MGRPKKVPNCTPSGGALRVSRVIHIDPVIVDRDTTCTIVGLSPSNIAAQVLKGTFPAPRKTSTNRIGWLLTEIHAWAQGLPLSDILPPPSGHARPQ